MGQTLGKSATESLMQAHWSSWITADDFQQMAGYGINIVRIPIGYWSVLPIAGDPYVQGAYAWLGKAIGWAGDNGIKVLIDLHGAPGSQNGLDNSGHKGPIEWLTQAGSYQHTIATLNKIRNDYASNPAVAAIELVNEPEGPDLNMDTVRQFYMDGWGNLKNSHVGIVFHDAFEGVTSWNDWGSGMWNLIEDTHHCKLASMISAYACPRAGLLMVNPDEVFDSTSLQNTTQQHVTTACGFGGQMASNNKVTIAGEWSGAMTDCAQWLNGRGIGARYDGTYDVDGTGSSYIGSCDGFYSGTVSGLSSQAKDNIGQFINAQIAAFEQAGGWIFWTCTSSPVADLDDS